MDSLTTQEGNGRAPGAHRGMQRSCHHGRPSHSRRGGTHLIPSRRGWWQAWVHRQQGRGRWQLWMRDTEQDPPHPLASLLMLLIIWQEAIGDLGERLK